MISSLVCGFGGAYSSKTRSGFKTQSTQRPCSHSGAWPFESNKVPASMGGKTAARSMTN